MRQYLVMTTLPFLLTCSQIEKNPCQGPPDITKLFSVYHSLRDEITPDYLEESSVKRMLDQADREYSIASDVYASCNHDLDYTIANQHALYAVTFITEAVTRQEEMNGVHFIDGRILE